jgi:hypothetical protein
MPLPEADPNNTTAFHPTIPREIGANAAIAPNRPSPKRKLIARAAAIVVTVSLAGYGAVNLDRKINSTHSLREQNLHEIATAHTEQIQNLKNLQESGDHTRTIGAMVVLMEGAKIRTSTAQANERLFGYVPGNVRHTVGKKEVMIFTNPLVTFTNPDSENKGAEWIQASEFIPPVEGSFEKGTAEALADATDSVNLTGLLEQKAAVICDQVDDSYATVTDNFGYAGPDGNQTAYVTTMPAATFEADVLVNGSWNCVNELK